MVDLFTQLFNVYEFMPHGHCYFWDRKIITFQVIADGLIALAYYSIPLSLAYFAKNRHDLPYKGIVLMFVAFIFACGTTHIMKIVTIWNPLYWLSTVIEVITALLSVTTAIVLVRIIPEALKLKSPAELEKLNKELEKQVLERQDAERKVLELNKTLVKHAEEVEEANKELEAFSYSVSHDLRAPLRAINGFAKILADDHSAQLGTEATRVLNVIRTNAQSMGLLIDNLLSFSRFSRQTMTHTQINMKELVQVVWQEVVPAQKAIELRVGELPPAYGDRNLVRQVVYNLLTNAVKYSSTKEKASVEVGSKVDQSENIYFVKDNGVGFDMAYAHKLFGVFQRLHSNEEFDGTGVGLAIVERIVRRHGGRVWAESQVNEGAIFYFTLPPYTGIQ